MPHTHMNYRENATGRRGDAAEVVRCHELERAMYLKSRELIDVEIDFDGKMFELEKDEHDGPKWLGGGVLSSSRR